MFVSGLLCVVSGSPERRRFGTGQRLLYSRGTPSTTDHGQLTTDMTATKKLLAFDLGAESGRGVLGLLDGQRLRLEVVHRFPNGPARTLDTLHWDVLRLHGEMLQALRLCAAQHGGVDSLGLDTWGVDFALLGRGGALLGNPRHYRDPHTEGVMEEA